MTQTIDGPRLAPASGKQAEQLVIFLHGYGADGNDLISLGREWADALPDAAFVSPHAPQNIPGYSMGGKQWFPLESRDEQEFEKGAKAADPILRHFIKQEAERHKLPFSLIALVGFSQGTMMALYSGLRLDDQLAGIVGYSGHLVGSNSLTDEAQVKPPILLIHGEHDSVIPVEAIHHARSVLAHKGYSVQWQVRPGLDHGIDPQGLEAAGLFLRSQFGLK